MCFMLLFCTWCKGAALGLFDFMKLPVNLHAAAFFFFFFFWLSFINLLAFVLVMSLLLAVSHCTDEYVCNCTLFSKAEGFVVQFLSWTLLCQLAFKVVSVNMCNSLARSFYPHDVSAFQKGPQHLYLWTFELLVLCFTKNVMIYEQGCW